MTAPPVPPQLRALQRQLMELPNVGLATAGALIRVGVRGVEDLARRDPDEMYSKLCALDGVRHDACIRDVFTAVVAFARAGEERRGWSDSARRKEVT